MKDQFTASEVSRFFRVTRTTVANWINKGKLTAYATPGGHFRVMRTDLIKFAKERNIPLFEELESPKYRILIVDDEQNIIESVRQILEDINVEMEVREATNGLTAGLELVEFKPHLVILDYLMPGADGDVVVKEIKERESLKNTKILVLTAYPDKGKKLVEMGADKFIEKASKDMDVENFRKEVCKLLGIKYIKFIPKETHEQKT